MTASVKDWPKSERPRERMRDLGIQALSDAELVAVLLRNGVRGEDALSFARNLLGKCGGLRGLFSMGWERLEKIRGLGPAKVATLLAVNEIARRKLREEILGKEVVRDPQAVVEYLYTSLRDQKKEIFKVLFLDKGNRILDEMDLFEGTVDQTAVHPREVVKIALERHATGLILVHNHPSGRVEPSSEDRMMTGKIQAALSAVGLQVLDHLIIGDNQFFSFKEHRLL